MSNVLIVEDEKAAIESIINMDVWHKSNFRICGTASNGREALIKYKKTRPDIIITDIEMPVMNGLDFLAEIRKKDTLTKVIILSCYESFAYAKRAIQLGVQDYLIKDFLEEGALYSALLNASRIKTSRTLKREEKENRYSSVEFNSKLFELLEEHDDSILSDLKQRYNSFNEFLLLYIHIDQFNEETSNIKTIAECILKELELNLVSLVSYMGQMYYAVLLFFKNGESHPPVVLETASNIIQQVENTYQLSLTISMGKPFNSMDKIEDEYINVQNLIKYRVFLGRGKVILPESIENLISLDPVILEKKISTLRHAIIKDDEDTFFYTLSQLYERDMAGMIQYNYIEYVNSNLISILINFLNKKNANELDTFTGDILELQELKKLETIREMHEWFKKKFTQSFKLAREAEEKISDNVIVREILSIIRNEYKNDLSVESIAKKVKIHRVYLNRLFKRETGSTCYDYIQKFRIEKAKQLLETENKKISEVAKESGFRNYDQFCVAFKKNTGETPTNFRKINKNI